MKDITTRQEIDFLVQLFYNKLKRNKVVGHFFTEVVVLSFEEHLPIVCDFWESILLDNRVYQGNVMIKHIELSQKADLTKEHFEEWLRLWNTTIDSLHQGEVANEAKKRAELMAKLMQFKIKQSKNDGFVM